MDPKQLLRSLQSTRDREVRAQINACYPAEWAMEAVFQKSYQTYLRAKGMPQVQETARPRIALSRVIAAAALLVAVGLGTVVWTNQQRIATVPETPAQTATQAVVEDATQDGSQMQTTPSVPAAASHPTETTDATVANQHAATAVPVSTTSAPSGTGSVPATTDAVTAAQRETDPTEAAPTKDPAPALAPTESPVLPTTAPPELPTAAPTETAVPSPTDVLATETGAPTEPPPVDYDRLPGFAVTEQDGRLTVTWLAEVAPTPDDPVVYRVDSERFVLEFAGRIAGHSEFWYDVYDTETDRHLRVTMSPRQAFSCILNAGGTLTPADVGDLPGFLYEDETGCLLCWDNGCYQCIIRAASEDAPLLPLIAASLVPA